MIKEEIIVKTKADFDREIENLKFDINIFSPVILASGIVKKTKTYKFTDYAAPVDTLVIVESGGSKRYSSGQMKTIDNTNCLVVFSGGATSETYETCSSTYWTDIWKWANSKDAINFLNSKIVDELGNEFSSVAYLKSQSVDASYYVEVTVRLVEDKPEQTFNEFKGGDPELYGPEYNCRCCIAKAEPTFKNDELVLVWDDDKDKAVLQYFEGYLDDKCEPYKFNCWVDGATELTAHGFGEMWKHCVKVCQKCGKEKCECK